MCVYIVCIIWLSESNNWEGFSVVDTKCINIEFKLETGNWDDVKLFFLFGYLIFNNSEISK